MGESENRMSLKCRILDSRRRDLWLDLNGGSGGNGIKHKGGLEEIHQGVQ